MSARTKTIKSSDLLFGENHFTTDNTAPLKSRLRVLIFIGSLASGGKERRLIEMLSYFKAKDDFEFYVVMSKDEIHYRDFNKLQIPYVVLSKRREKYDVSAFRQLFNICKVYRPHFIHTWGSVQTFYSLPTVLLQHIPLLNSQITSAPPYLKQWSIRGLINRLNFLFSKIVLSNSQAGIEAYNPPRSKSKVIYNGINLKRFSNLPDPSFIKAKYGITTPHLVLMVASFSSHKDYHRFFSVADCVTKLRSDITFMGVGASAPGDSQFEMVTALSKANSLMLFPGKVDDVEALISVSTIGVLFSNAKLHGEGISNAVMEYMSLGKPVIANDAGGTREIVFNNKNGYLIKDETAELIGKMILTLIDNVDLYNMFGAESKKIIDQHFLLNKMGEGFEQVYFEMLKRGKK